MSARAGTRGARRGGMLRRTRAMARKEVLHIVRDPRTLYMALGMPVVLILLFGYAVTFDIDHVPVALVDQDRSPESRSIAEALAASGEIVVATRPEDPAEVDGLMRRGVVAAGIVLPAGMGEDLGSGRTSTIQLLVDGSDGTRANSVLGTVSAIARAESARILVAAMGTDGMASVGPTARVRLLYNPALRSAIFLVPGLVAFILAIGAVLLTALAVAREWERGTMEQLFATPVSRLEVILGKLFPYLAIGLVQALLVLVVGATAFDVPIRGDLALLGLSILLFLAAMLGQGLLISVVTRNQQVATQVGAISSFLPSMLLSGFIFPVENMPWALRAIAELFPARHLVTLLRGVMLKGSGVETLWPHLAAMAAFTFVVLAASTARFKRRLG